MNESINTKAVVQCAESKGWSVHVDGTQKEFDGNVVVAYSEDDDLYEVYLLNCAGARRIGKGCFFDQLGDIIDIAIERGKDIAEYHRFCEQEGQRLFYNGVHK